MTNRELAKYGLRQGAYDGAARRRFVLFQRATRDGEAVEIRREFDSKGARDLKARLLIADMEALEAASPASTTHRRA